MDFAELNDMEIKSFQAYYQEEINKKEEEEIIPVNNDWNNIIGKLKQSWSGLKDACKDFVIVKKKPEEITIPNKEYEKIMQQNQQLQQQVIKLEKDLEKAKTKLRTVMMRRLNSYIPVCFLDGIEIIDLLIPINLSWKKVGVFLSNGYNFFMSVIELWQIINRRNLLRNNWVLGGFNIIVGIFFT